MQSLPNVHDSVKGGCFSIGNYTDVRENNEIFSEHNYFKEQIYVYQMFSLIKITILCVSGSIKATSLYTAYLPTPSADNLCK